jgi:hypothetical protein
MTGWYTHGLENGRALRVRISELATPAEFREAVAEFFESAVPVLPNSDEVARGLSLVAS